jgi:hypothetical protein
MILFEFLLSFCNDLFGLRYSRCDFLSLLLEISINCRFHIVSLWARGRANSLSWFALINEPSFFWWMFLSWLASLCWNIHILTLKLFFWFICESVIMSSSTRSAVHFLNMLFRWLLCYLPFYSLYTRWKHHLLNRIILAIFRFLGSRPVVRKLYLLLARVVVFMKKSLFMYLLKSLLPISLNLRPSIFHCLSVASVI